MQNVEQYTTLEKQANGRIQNIIIFVECTRLDYWQNAGSLVEYRRVDYFQNVECSILMVESRLLVECRTIYYHQKSRLTVEYRTVECTTEDYWNVEKYTNIRKVG